jgi:tRNA threonylcarbamoyl adenosine modification protein (Sua5/YciO/YrdC/YwlC family)
MYREFDIDIDAEVLAVDPDEPQEGVIAQAAQHLRMGHAAVIPTDTVYGVCALPRFVDQLYAIKQRDADKAIPWLVSAFHDLEAYAANVAPYAYQLAHRFWPGALTLIVPAAPTVPREACAADGSIALRMPANTVALALIDELGLPLATSSANLQGERPATSLDTLNTHVAEKCGLVLDAGSTPGPTPSTIVSCLGEEPVVLRQGNVWI